MGTMRALLLLTGVVLLVALVAPLTFLPNDVDAQQTPQEQIVTLPVSGMT